MGYFDPENVFLIMKINNFRGDLTDISAKTEALAMDKPSVVGTRIWKNGQVSEDDTYHL